MNTMKKTAGFTKLIILVLGIILLFLILQWFKKPDLKMSSQQEKSMGKRSSAAGDERTKKSEENKGTLTLDDKVKKAEAYQAGYMKERDAFFSSVEGRKFTPQELQKQMEKFNSMTQGYVNKLNALQLVCPQYAQSTGDQKYAKYIAWTEDFRKRDEQVMQDTNERIQKILNESGFNQQ